MTPRVLTWHVHGSYLAALAHGAAQGRYALVLPTRPGKPEGYGGWPADRPRPPNVDEVDAGDLAATPVDLVLTQSQRNWEADRHDVCSAEQLRLPRIHLEHDPPRKDPTDTRHPVDDPGVLLVHVTHFNDLMWDSGRTPTAVVEHAVAVPDGVTWSGNRERGLVVVNDLPRRGRRVGADLVGRVAGQIPLTLAGIGSEALGGLGEVPAARLPALAAEHRFFFHPIRYTSLGLAVVEALLLGVPVVGLATTELVTVIDDGVTGFVSTDIDLLVTRMRSLLADRELAARLGAAGRHAARVRFGIDRFATDWERTFRAVLS